MNRIDHRTDTASGEIRLRTALWTGIFGFTMGTLFLVVAGGAKLGVHARIAAGIALLLLYVLAARGVFPRWMSLADEVFNGWFDRVLAGRRASPWTPSGSIYGGVFYAGASIPLLISPVLPAIDSMRFAGMILGGIAVFEFFHGLLWQRRWRD